MFKKIYNSIKNFIIEEYKFLICMLFFYIVCIFPVNYYIVIGGGISDVSERIEVSDATESKGSFNISYVSELKGTVLTYLLSYIIPSWDRESINDYKYSDEDSYDDIEFRGDIDLKSANSCAIKTAYSLANEKVEKISSSIYVIATFDEYETGLKVQDELISIDGNKFENVNQYSDYLQGVLSGEEVEVEVLRNKKKNIIKCKVYESDGRKILGVALQIVNEYETEPKVEIKFNSSESGPSGGLVTTLEIYDQLVDADITNGLKIAGTGTVDNNGNVGSIGGVRYKLIGAEAGHADLFLVPAGKNYKEALKVKKEKRLDIEIISVSTVLEAVEKLQGIGE